MKITSKYLYELLPAYYRTLDYEQGEPLKAFMKVLAREVSLVELNIDQLYENWFIETCEEWVVPYIGELLGVRGVNQINENNVYSRRAYVANTLSYRRRKGTAPILEQLAQDTTGWRARVVEFFQLLATSQNLNHLRLHNATTADLKQMNQLNLINTAFDTTSHTVEVGRISQGVGRYNIQNIGLYLWRLQSYPLTRVDAKPIYSTTGNPDIPNGAYTFNVLGQDSHLFNLPESEEEITHIAEEINVPGLLRRRALHDELEQLRSDLVNERTPAPYFFGKNQPAFQLFINEDSNPIPFEEIIICNLSNWPTAPSTKTYLKELADGAITSIDKTIKVAVDPVLGRIVFSNPDDINELVVSYNYGFSGDVGGGPYDRKESLSNLDQLQIDWQVGVSKDHESVHTETIYPTLQEAIEEWNAFTGKKIGLITILDSRTYEENLTGNDKIKISKDQQLYIIAADWPAVDLPNGASNQKERRQGTYNPENIRPHIKGDIEILGNSQSNAIVLNGLLIEGNVEIINGQLDACTIDHCTIVPTNGKFIIENQEEILNLFINRSIVGMIEVLSEDANICISDSIIDHQEGIAIAAEKNNLIIEKSTIWGTIHSQTLEAANSIFNDQLKISRRQTGCVRFSYLPLDSKVPQQFRCQPQLEIDTEQKIQKEEKGRKLTDSEKEMIKEKVLNWLVPNYNSVIFKHHAYAQLGQSSPNQIVIGADNAAEMGVFNHLQQPQRIANLEVALDEYLRLGLEAGLIFVT